MATAAAAAEIIITAKPKEGLFMLFLFLLPFSGL
jgi:hypothetical protein